MTAHVLILAMTLAAQAGPPVASARGDRTVRARFEASVQSYATMRDRFDRGIGRPADGRLADYERQLGDRIRIARRGANAGEFFTPEVQAMFRRLLTTFSPEIMALQFSDDDADEDATPQGAARRHVIHVNEQYPEDAPRSRIPFAVLARLPSLPTDVEYRFHGRDLLLHDVRANVVLDIMRNAAQ